MFVPKSEQDPLPILWWYEKLPKMSITTRKKINNNDNNNNNNNNDNGNDKDDDDDDIMITITIMI